MDVPVSASNLKFRSEFLQGIHDEWRNLEKIICQDEYYALNTDARRYW